VSRYRSSGSYGHKALGMGHGDWKLMWVVDYYYPDSRLRYPRSFSRYTDEEGAKRFRRKWEIQDHNDCAADCDKNTFKAPICETCLCCKGCAGAYDYAQNLPGAPPPTEEGKCPECGL